MKSQTIKEKVLNELSAMKSRGITDERADLLMKQAEALSNAGRIIESPIYSIRVINDFEPFEVVGEKKVRL